MKILGNRIVLKDLTSKTETTTPGGLIIPTTVDNTDTLARARVAYVGTGKITDSGVNIPVPCKVGDVVLYNKNTVVPFKLAGEDYLMCLDSNIFAIEEVGD
jgi:co-chaperonin GroES (HSP10)